MKKYIKLGETAESFYDAFIGLQTSKPEVLEFQEKWMTSKRFKNAIASGHLQWADEKEFNSFSTGTKVAEEEAPAPFELDADMDEETITQQKMPVIQLAAESFFDDDDLAELKGIKSKADYVAKVVELLANYK